jgi:hypothetical protein
MGRALGTCSSSRDVVKSSLCSEAVRTALSLTKRWRKTKTCPEHTDADRGITFHTWTKTVDSRSDVVLYSRPMLVVDLVSALFNKLQQMRQR